MRVLFVLPRIVSGGVERVTLNLLRRFVADGHDCTLALRRAHGEFLEEARSLVKVHEFAPNGMHQFVPGMSRVIRAWQPTHIITAFPDVAFMTWLAMRMANSDARWIHGVHNTHDAIIARPGVMGWLRHKLENRIARIVYRNADATVAVSDGVRNEVLAFSGVDPDRVVTIYNPVLAERQLIPLAGPGQSSTQEFRIVALGRLAKQKGFDVLVKAMAKVPQPWLLDIWGEGPERAHLASLIRGHGLESVIRLRGYTGKPLEVMRDADLFVLPSRHEGLPTVLVEALASQCQVVATDCLHGPREILQGGRLGQLVPVEAIDGLASAIDRVRRGQFHVEPMALLSRARDFTADEACRKWLALLYR